MPGETTFARDDRTTVAKKRLLRMHFESGVGHIGGNLSCLDLLLSLFCDHLYSDDRFVLSKGHSAGALYVALWASGRLDEAALATFHRDATQLAGHPVAGWHPDILFATGSLGHGASLAAGVAHAKAMRGAPGTVFCLLSDGELNEGSTWEALHYIAHHRLSNVSLVVDLNGLQGYGRTEETMSIGPLMPRLTSLGFDVASIDGHDAGAIGTALTPRGGAAPRAVVARTVKGHGVSFMADRMEWHYLPLTEALYAQALSEIDARASAPRVARAVRDEASDAASRRVGGEHA